MSSTRPIILIAVLSAAVGCYAPHSPVVTGDGSTGDVESGSTTAVTVSASTTGDTTASMTTTVATDDSGSSDDSGSTTGSPVCGDAVVNGDEVCDDGVNDGSYGGCLADCSELGPHCGDAIQQADEACDDGDQTNGNGCNIDCIVSGTVLWSRIVDGPAHVLDFGNAVAIDDDDAIYAVGSIDQTTGWIRRYDAEGTEDWTQTFVGPNSARPAPRAAAWGGAPELHIVGTQHTDADPTETAWFRRFTSDDMSDGSFNWNNPAGEDHRAVGIAVNDDGQTFVFGDTYRPDLGQGWNLWLRKLDADGGEMWTQSYDTGDSDYAGGVAVDGEGNVIAAGWVGTATESDNVWLRKYSTEGGTLWTRSYNDPGDCSDQAFGVAVDVDDSVVIAGTTCGDIFVRKYGSDGSVEWHDTDDGGGPLEWGASIRTDAQKAIVVVGTQHDSLQRAWVRKYSSEGQELWTYSYEDDSLVSHAEAVAVDSTSAIVVTGYTHDYGTGEGDIWLQKFAP